MKYLPEEPRRWESLWDGLLLTLTIFGILLIATAVVAAMFYVFLGVLLMSGPQEGMALNVGVAAAGIPALLVLSYELRRKRA